MNPVNSELVWLASAVDFEGSILMYPNWNPKGISTSIRANTTVLTNTNPVLLRYARKLLTKYNINHRLVPLYKGKKWSKKWKKAWRVEVSPVDDNKILLELLLPYLIGKKRQCEIALEFLFNHNSKHNKHRKTTEHEWKLMLKCQALNKRGVVNP